MARHLLGCERISRGQRQPPRLVRDVVGDRVVVQYYLLRLRAIAGIGVRKLVPFRTLLGTMLATCVPAGVALLLRGVDLLPLVRLVLIFAVFSVVATIVLRVTRRINDDDWRRILGVARRLRAAHVPA
jgi:hypothetical protein